MMRINLLPPEILERRRAERRIGWVALAAVVVGVLLAGVWAFGYFRLESKKDELAEVQQLVQSTQAQAAQLAIFEERAAELEQRRAIAERALASRRNWGKLYNELSLVLPSDVWLQNLVVGEASGLAFSAVAVDAPSDNPDAGHKAIARTLVRLTDLDDLYDVWLGASSKSTFAAQPSIQFSVTAKVVTPGVEEGANQ
jgi:Tfp pilus assembly protein PilN